MTHHVPYGEGVRTGRDLEIDKRGVRKRKREREREGRERERDSGVVTACVGQVCPWFRVG